MAWPNKTTHVGRYVAIHRNGRADREHRKIAEAALGKPLPAGVEVHHFDGDGRNNAHGNLVICQDHAYHFLLHQRRRIVLAGGDPDRDAWCRRCLTARPVELFTRRSSGKLVTICRPCNRIVMREWKAGRSAAPETVEQAGA